MPAFDHHFMPLHPALEGDDYLQLQSQGLITYQTKSGHELLVRFLCLDEQIRVIAVSVPEAAAAHPDQPKWMKQIMENAISAIRLSVEPEASPIVMANGFINLMYQSDDPIPQYRFPISFPRNPEYRLDISQVAGVFGALTSKTLAQAAALLGEGQAPAIPLHYRVLSLIRAIELLYPDETVKSVALDRFEDHFAGLNISKHPFRNALPQLRTRCAHGVSRGRLNPEPFVGIGYNEPILTGLAVLLASVVAHGLQDLHGLQFGGMQYTIEA